MASFTIPGPAGLGLRSSAIDSGTLCRAATSPPGPVGLIGTGTQWLADAPAAEPETPPAGIDLDAYLQAITKPQAPPQVRQRVQIAAEFFESRFQAKSFDQIVAFLKGIDFSKDVRISKLAAMAPHDSHLIQYVAGGRPGNFFARPGVAHGQLGVALGTRQFRRFRVVNIGVDVLVSTAAPMSDTWTHGRTMDVYSPIPGHQPWQPPARAGEFAGGGGLQIIIPDPVGRYVELVE
jgi:hypothetical protein